MIRLSEEQRTVINSVREMAKNKIAPRAREIDREARFPKENFRALGEMGILGALIPKKWGGAELDTGTYVLIQEEVAKACGSTGLALSVHVGAQAFIDALATAKVKAKYLPDMASGNLLASVAITEPNAGSDAASISATTARLEGDHYIIDGTKIFITNAECADVFIVYTRTKPGAGSHGITAFMMDKSMPGFQLGRIEDKMGMRASGTGELVFEGVEVPRENMLGKENEGFSVAMTMFDLGRIIIASLAVGVAQAALEAAIGYAKERKAFGQTISSFQGIQFMLADMATQVETARLLTQRAAMLRDAGLPHAKEASMAKFLTSDVAMRVTDQAIDIFGTDGVSEKYPFEMFMRDAKVLQILEGTNQIHRLVISRSLLR